MLRLGSGTDVVILGIIKPNVKVIPWRYEWLLTEWTAGSAQNMNSEERVYRDIPPHVAGPLTFYHSVLPILAPFLESE